ncbi:MAG: hypothetical protein ACR2HF_16210 [Methylococcaceae bacterium]
MQNINKTGLTALVTASIALAAIAPQTALADKHNTKSSVSGTSSVQADLERRLQMMEDEMRALRSELSRTRHEAQSASDKVDAHQQKVEQHIADSASHTDSKDDLIFFRGGFASMEHPRNSELLLNNDTLRGLGVSSQFDAKDGNGWYVGAGFDHRLTSDMWGLTDVASLDGEVMFEYKNFGTSHNTLVEGATGTIAAQVL